MDARVVLNSDTSSAGAARRFTRDTLETWGLTDHVDTAVLLVSELVTNAVLHARSASELVLSTDGVRLRVEVHDDSLVLPTRRHYGVQAGTGRGMLLIEEMANLWGAEHTDVGKVVWFELEPGSVAGGAFMLDASALADLADLGMDTGGAQAGAVLDDLDRDDPAGRIECLAGVAAGTLA